jgi:predicted nucleic acid-binding Zn ribbon protein
MSLPSFMPDVRPQAARAAVGASQQGVSRCCPVCGRPLEGSQRTACSGRCRAERARQRAEQAASAKKEDLRALLHLALQRLEKP